MLIPDREDYQPGDVAEILVQSPFTPPKVCSRCAGRASSQRAHHDGWTDHTLQVPIEEAFIPNLYVQVDLVGAAPRLNDAGDRRTHRGGRRTRLGELNLTVPPLARTLALEVSPRDVKIEPGGKTSVDVTLGDAQADAG